LYHSGNVQFYNTSVSGECSEIYNYYEGFKTDE
jgi:hypothetical protein